MKIILLNVIAVLFVWFIVPNSAWAIDSSEDWERLLSGKVIVEAVENHDDIPGLRVSFCVNAHHSSVWASLIDYDNFPKMFSGVNAVRVLNQDGTGATVEFSYQVTFLKLFTKEVHYTLKRHYLVPGRHIPWTRASGDMKRIEGSWRIIDSPRLGVSLLVYESYIEIGGLMPTGWIRQAAMSDAPDMADHVRKWIESNH